MRTLKNWANQLCNNNQNELLKWAVISAFFILVGDIIAFALALASCQGNSNNNCSIQAQINDLEKKIAEKNQTKQEIIKILEEKINELKSTF